MNTTPDATPPGPDRFAQPISLGRRRHPSFAWLQTAGIVVLLAAVAGIPISVGYATWRDHRSLRAEWTAAGAACPVTPRLSLGARGAKPPPPFTYGGARFAYQIGDAECAAVPESSPFDSSHYTACQFDAAGAVEVSYSGRTTIFEPGVGHGAIVTIRKGRVSCVLEAQGRFHGPSVGRQLQQARDHAAAPARRD
jgi:hypothetical protein